MHTTTTRNEGAALDVLTMKGAQLRHAGFCAAVLPLALHSYKHGSDKEQWSSKGSLARPLRGAWAHVFTPAANGRLPADAAARAFRAVAAALTSEDRTAPGLRTWSGDLRSTSSRPTACTPPCAACSSTPSRPGDR